jgi:hypothetical protein
MEFGGLQLRICSNNAYYVMFLDFLFHNQPFGHLHSCTQLTSKIRWVEICACSKNQYTHHAIYRLLCTSTSMLDAASTFYMLKQFANTHRLRAGTETGLAAGAAVASLYHC